MKKLFLIIVAPAILICSVAKVYALSSQDLFSLENDSIYYTGSNKNHNSGVCGNGNVSSQALTSGQNVYILGDSITERAESAYITTFKGLGVNATVDAQYGRSLTSPGGDGTKTTGMQAIAIDQASIKSANAIVIALGTNGGDTPQSIDRAISAIRADNATAPIFWVDTIVIDRPDYLPVIQAANQAIYGQAKKEGYSVISWFKEVDPNNNPIKITGKVTDNNGYISLQDGLNVHPTEPKGVEALVNLVVGQVTGSGTSNSAALVCCNNGAPTTLTGGGSAEQAFNFFVQSGFTPVAAAGIVGNLMYESDGTSGAIDPTKVQGDGDSSFPTGSGWGSPQWTPSTKVLGYAQQAGITTPIDLLSTQLKIILWEFSNNYQGLKQQLNSATSVSNYSSGSTAIFMNNFERPKTNESIQYRIQDAVSVLKSSGGSTVANTATCSPTSSTGGYQNPFRNVTTLSPGRIDQGVDYTGNGPVYAVGSGTVTGIFQNWCTPAMGGCEKGEPLIAYQLTAGSAAGKVVYLAECITPRVSVGQTVSTNTIIATVINNPGCDNGIETGWLNPSDEPTSMAYSCFNGQNSTAFGDNFNQLMVSLGVVSGIQNPPVTCTLPAGWPTWQ
jgi:murein DD-endopeptidase MepM/ murein hydrolase activator NlpD